MSSTAVPTLVSGEIALQVLAKQVEYQLFDSVSMLMSLSSFSFSLCSFAVGAEVGAGGAGVWVGGPGGWMVFITVPGCGVARASVTFVCMEDAGSGVGTSAATVALMDSCICRSVSALASAVSVATLGCGVAVTCTGSGAWVHPRTADIVTMIRTAIEVRTGFRTFLFPGFPAFFRREVGVPVHFQSSRRW